MSWLSISGHQFSRVERHAVQELAGGGGNGIGDSRRQRRHTRFADAGRIRVAADDRDLDRRHLCDPQHQPITEADAHTYLAHDLQTALNATLRYCPVLATETEARLAAIVDFTFNLGVGRLQTSTLRRRINQRDWQNAANELRRWVYGGGRVLPGLVARRNAEAALL